MPGLGCSMWDLIPWPAVESRRPALRERGSATGAQGSPGVLFLLQPISSMWCQFVPSLMVFALITFLIWYLLGLSLGGSVVKNLPVMQETWVQSLGQEDPQEVGIGTHSSILAWRIPLTEEPGRSQSIGSKGVEHDWSSLACTDARHTNFKSCASWQ